jgi:hypothetical protein
MWTVTSTCPWIRTVLINACPPKPVWQPTHMVDLSIIFLNSVTKTAIGLNYSCHPNAGPLRFSKGQFVSQKWSDLVFKWFKQDGCCDHPITGHKLCPINGRSNTGQSIFWMATVVLFNIHPSCNHCSYIWSR